MTLEIDLRNSCRAEVRFAAADRAMYASDASNYRHAPRAVVLPRSVEDIAACVRVCQNHGVPIVHRGGGTALAGQTTGPDAVIIDSSKYCREIRAIDPGGGTADVEPGCVLDDLRDAASQYGLTFGPDPATHNHCTLGGMIGNNSCGVHSVRNGRTLDNVVSLDILTADGVRMIVGETPPPIQDDCFRKAGREGEIYRDLWTLQERHADLIRQHTPPIPRLVSGYRLEQLLPEHGFNLARALVGSESTCATILGAKVKLVPNPAKALLVAGFDSLPHAADAIPEILKMSPAACEAMDDRLIGYMRKKNFHIGAISALPPGAAWLLIEASGDTPHTAQLEAEDMKTRIDGLPHVISCQHVEDPEAIKELWDIRKSGLGATAWIPGRKKAAWPGWEDSAVHPGNVGEYVRKLQSLLDRYGLHAAMYGHMGDGLIHMRPDFGLHTNDQVETFRRFMEDASELVTSLGGTLSGEHGDGQARSELLEEMYGREMIEVFGEFKRIWDPGNLMNPGNIVAPRKLDEDFRYGPDYRPAPRTTLFSFKESGGDFRSAAMRCVGIGECRKMSGGTMCPSYRATREEKHSTRGRARLFQEMLRGDPVRANWKSSSVREALDLCLSCKACKHECPVNVDLATFKAEFLHHHYKGKLRPRVQLAIGNISRLARLGSLAPELANLVTRQDWAKRLVGIHPDRGVPELAKQAFRAQWTGTKPGNSGRVILWPDTFNNHFSPEALKATVGLITQTGHSVEIPRQHLCCGRPFYDFGMLNQARAHLKRLMQHLAPLLDEETWIVGIEPSCMAVFRDELPNMFPDDSRARHLSRRALMLSEFLEQHTDYSPPDRSGDVLVHGHCHHKSVLGFEADETLIQSTGATVQVLDSGCCGMSGSFGYDRDKYSYSVDIAEQVLLPAIASCQPDSVIVANGFSCRSQIKDLAGVNALTLPEFLMMQNAGEA